MNSHPTEKRTGPWVISPASFAKWTFDALGNDKKPRAVREHKISTIAHYLISPKPVQVERWLVGCEIHWRASRWAKLKSSLHPSLRKKSLKAPPATTLVSDFSRPMMTSVDEKFVRHIQALHEKLHGFDSFLKTLDDIDNSRAEAVVGICEDDGGNRSQLMIAGDTAHQLSYVHSHVGKKIDVRLNRAQFADGLFELKGFDFQQYDPEASFRLLRLVHDGAPRACVLNDDHSIAFWLEDPKLVNYLQLFEFSIQQNRHMHESLHQCIRGQAVPMRLMFNHALEIDYSQAPLPKVFKEAIGPRPLADHTSQLIKENLNLHQLGVSLNSYLLQENGDGGVRTDISILQNLRALEPIKKRLPKLFDEMTKRAGHSEAGTFYLLDAVRGGHHEA